MEYIDNAREYLPQSLSRVALASLQVVFAVAIFFFVNPTYISPALVAKKDLHEVGAVSEAVGKVFVQRGRDPNWWPVKEEEKIFAGDRLFTAEGSQLGIKLSDGRQAWIRPNSILQIRDIAEQDKLYLEAGELYVNFISGQRLLLVNGDIVLANEPAQLYVQSQGTEQEFTVKHGSISLYNRDLQLKEQLFQRKTLEQMQQELKLVSPFGTLHTKVNHVESEVEFHWAWAGDPMLWALEVSSDPEFSHVDYSTAYLSESSTRQQLPSGNWYWRIKARRRYSEKIYESAGLEFTIIVPQPVRGLTSLPAVKPPPSAAWQSSGKKQTMVSGPDNIRFSANTADYTRVDWDYPSPTNRFYWQISCSDNFKTRDLNAYTGQAFFIMRMQDYINCLFRVRSYSKKSMSIWSQPVKIRSLVGHNE